MPLSKTPPPPAPPEELVQRLRNGSPYRRRKRRSSEQAVQQTRETFLDAVFRLRHSIHLKLFLYSEETAAHSAVDVLRPAFSTASIHSAGKGHAEISHRELFFDLIFVVVCIEVGIFMGESLSASQLGLAFLTFTSFWLEWFHTNEMLACIKIPSPWSNCLLLVMIGALGLAAKLLSSDEQGNVILGRIDTNRVPSAIFLLLPKVAFGIIYGNIFIFSLGDKVKKWRLIRSGIFLFGFVVSSICCIIMAAMDSQALSTGLWIALVALEIVLYFVVVLVIPEHRQWKVTPTYSIERNNVWIFLCLGEVILSLASSGSSNSTSYFVNFVLGFILIYIVMRMHHLAQPNKVDVMVHAFYGSALRALLNSVCVYLISIGIMCVGVGFKFTLSYPYEEYHRAHAWMLVAGLSNSFFWGGALQFTDFYEVQPETAAIYDVEYDHVWGRYRRVILYLLKMALGLLMLPIATLVDTKRGPANGDGDDGATVVTEGITSSQLIGILLCFTCVQMVLTYFTKPTTIEVDLMHRMRAGLPLLRRYRTGALRRQVSSQVISRLEGVPEGDEAAERRSGKELWAMLRWHVDRWRYSQRVARMFQTMGTGELHRPGDVRLSHLDGEGDGLAAATQYRTSMQHDSPSMGHMHDNSHASSDDMHMSSDSGRSGHRALHEIAEEPERESDAHLQEMLDAQDSAGVIEETDVDVIVAVTSNQSTSDV